MFAWHIAPGAFLNLLPPWEARLVGPDQGISPGCLRQLRATPLGVLWWAYHEMCRRWAHIHRFEPETASDFLSDEVDF
ncbi:hypothetical protein IV102_18315 [bacterium]|nr:hypothetical protein [bacterium]